MEMTIMQRATVKRKLEALVFAEGRCWLSVGVDSASRAIGLGGKRAVSADRGLRGSKGC